MSNSIGIIESQFSGFIANGELYGITLLVDNVGDKLETIKPGDRVAQVLVLDRQNGGGSGYSFPKHSEITDWCTEKDEWQLMYEGRRGGFGSTGS
jgi:dUTPase